mmetsp:Transcript_8748/g.16107  ORF Transcript_8748/g.16107 Transcript_8748/m.16107 type:complete len:85 (-) Transcript_8748:966-1220(-)
MHDVKPNQPPKKMGERFVERDYGGFQRMIHALVRDNALLPTTSISGLLGCEALKQDHTTGYQGTEIQSSIISRDKDAFLQQLCT